MKQKDINTEENEDKKRTDGDAPNPADNLMDEQPEIASQYRIQAMPTMLFFKQGQVDSQIVGFKNKRELQAKFTEIVA